MKKLVISAVLFLTILLSVKPAYAVFVPEWQGLEGTTYQQWNFEDAENPAAPEIISNTYGGATAAITVGAMGSNWMNNPGLGTRTGMWDIGGSDGRIVLDIDNRPTPLPYKEIWIQTVYYESITGAAAVSVIGGQFVSSQTVLVEQDGVLGAWYLQQSIWRITPNPSHEQIILTGNASGSVIDQITVDTYCVPEPVSMLLLAGGGLAMLRKKRR